MLEKVIVLPKPELPFRSSLSSHQERDQETSVPTFEEKKPKATQYSYIPTVDNEVHYDEEFKKGNLPDIYYNTVEQIPDRSPNPNDKPSIHDTLSNVEPKPPYYLASSEIIEEPKPLSNSDQDEFNSFLNGDYVLDLNSVTSFQPTLPQASSLEPYYQNDHHIPPPNVLPTLPRNRQPNLINDPSRPAPRQSYITRDAPRKTKELYYDSFDTILNANPQYHYDSITNTPPDHFDAAPSLSNHLQNPSISAFQTKDIHQIATFPAKKYTPIATVPVSVDEFPFQQILAANGIATSSHDADPYPVADSIPETVKFQNFGIHDNVVHNEQHHPTREETDKDHYLEKLLKIANGELGNDYDILKENHNPHRARKNYKKHPVIEEPAFGLSSSKSSYLPVPEQPKEESVEYFENDYVNPTLRYKVQNEAKKLLRENPFDGAPDSVAYKVQNEVQKLLRENPFEVAPDSVGYKVQNELKKLSPIEDPFDGAPDSKSTYHPSPSLPKQETSYIDSSEDKYRNPKLHHENKERNEANQILVKDDPYYEVQEDLYYEPLVSHNLEESNLHHTTPHFHHNNNNLKSEERYFNVPLPNDGGPEISLIGVGDLDNASDDYETEPLKHEHEVYTVTDLKKTNLASGRQHHGGGFATQDGFYYTKTEDYNPASERVNHYTEVSM